MFPIVKNRASFDLHCPKDQLKLVTLAVDDPKADFVQHPTQVGVEGCGRQAVYVKVKGSGWVMNSSDHATPD